MTKQAYVVIEAGYDYNDEYHFVHENNEGNAVAVWLDKAAAEKDAAQRTINNFLKGWAGKELHGFGCEGLNSVFDRMPAFLEAEGMDPDTFFDWDAAHAYDSDSVLKIAERSDEELEEIVAAMNFKPYYVEEVPLG